MVALSGAGPTATKPEGTPARLSWTTLLLAVGFAAVKARREAKKREDATMIPGDKVMKTSSGEELDTQSICTLYARAVQIRLEAFEIRIYQPQGQRWYRDGTKECPGYQSDFRRSHGHAKEAAGRLLTKDLTTKMCFWRCSRFSLEKVRWH